MNDVADERGRLWDAPPEFRGRVVSIAEKALRDDAGLRSALERWDELLTPTLLKTIEEQSPTLLARTSRELDDLRQRRKALSDFAASPTASPVALLERQVGVCAGMLAFLATPVAVWQSWPALSTAIGGFWAVVLTAVGVVVLASAGTTFFLTVPVRAAERRASDNDDTNFTLIVCALLGMCVVAYLISLWQLLTPTVANLGAFGAAVIWIPTGLLATLLAACGVAVVSVSEMPTARKWRGAGVAFASIATAVLTWQFLTPPTPLPGHVPELAALLAALVFGTTGPTAVHLTVAAVRRVLVITVGRMVPSGPAGLILRTKRERHEAVLANDISESLRRWEEAATPLVVQQLQIEITKRVSPGFATLLGRISPHGLQQMRGSEYIVHTRAFDRLSAEITGLSGGAVGLAGPRGAGKSSLLDQYRAGRIVEAGTAGRQLVINESVPVTYEPKEYVLYLYGRLCQAVLDFAGPARTARRYGNPPNVAVALAVGTAWLAALLLGTGKWPGLDYKPPAWLANGWFALVLTGVLVGVIALGVGNRRVSEDAAADGQGIPANLDELRQRAERGLRSVRFQQKETFGSTGKVRLPFAAERGVTATRELQRHPMPYPEIANELHTFLTMTTRVLVDEGEGMSRIPVVIVFDELDKMADPDLVQDFLNTVKSLFSLDIPGCLFLVSVSEDALARFERRGLPIRDAIDSTFDAVVPVEYLNLDDATALIADRVAGLPDPFIALLHTLGGGLPRELLRYTRSLVRHRDEKHLGAIARALVGEELRMKARALGAVIARRGLTEPCASDLMRFVNDHIDPDPDVLLKAVGAPPLGPGLAEDLADALHLQMEALGYVYYGATVLQVFENLDEHHYKRSRASFDTLASARQLFAVNARLAWLTVSSFRRQWSLPEVAPPE